MAKTVFSRIQTTNFRCLKAIDCRLGRYAALVGKNASGKSTMLDAIGLLGEIAATRGDVAPLLIEKRSSNFEQLLWRSQGSQFELAVEAPIPDAIRANLTNGKRNFALVRYELGLGIDRRSNEIGIDHEALWLKLPDPTAGPSQRTLFPQEQRDPQVVLTPRKTAQVDPLLKKNPLGNDNFYAHGSKRFNPSFKLGRNKSALANLPEDEESFPVATWFRSLLERGVQSLILNSLAIRRPSAPGLGRGFRPDGSNLPWVVESLRTSDPGRFKRWLDHVRTGLDDVIDIRTVERTEDKHRYLSVRYDNGTEVPSWLVSDGTLRLLALTLPAYVADMDGVYLIEEPENGIHPRAIETVVQSLSSVYSGQVLMATHSPVALNILEPSKVLCFAKDAAGATDIVSGDQHPALRHWKAGEPDLGTLFAAGILS